MPETELQELKEDIRTIIETLKSAFARVDGQKIIEMFEGKDLNVMTIMSVVPKLSKLLNPGVQESLKQDMEKLKPFLEKYKHL